MSSMIPIFIMPIAVLDSIHVLSEFFDRYPETRDRHETISRGDEDARDADALHDDHFLRGLRLPRSYAHSPRCRLSVSSWPSASRWLGS